MKKITIEIIDNEAVFNIGDFNPMEAYGLLSFYTKDLFMKIYKEAEKHSIDKNKITSSEK